MALRQRICVVIVFQLPSLPCRDISPIRRNHASPFVPQQSKLGQTWAWAAGGVWVARADAGAKHLFYCQA